MIKKSVLFLCTIALLSACTQKNTSEVTRDKKQTDAVTSTIANQSGDYRMLFIDGKYRTSSTRGYTLELATVENISAFEIGLMNLSKSEFNPSQFYFIEGQFITNEEINHWLAVKSQENPNGLNSKQENNMLISTILEQDYMILNNGNYEFSGVSIGLALNPKTTASATLTDEELLAKGKEIVNQLLPLLRAKEGFDSIPIMFGLFKQSVDNGLSHGTYFATATSNSGTSVSKWSNTKLQKRVFPLETDKTEESSVFIAFKRNVEKFFPNLNGIVGNATFTDGAMSELDIKITTQFYGQAEMIAFEQFLVEQAGMTYSASELSVKIRVETVRGTELVVYKRAGENTYHSIVLN
ncbi:MULTISPECIES: CamS family sex pheromone protein [unclassified Granulicatella]|uniref:CamS family sex pheromone protein n=1 Tax=unclassified Granulicatella TaxID=2630493 RepID=UPI001D1657A9|nr:MULTISPECIES: CamS family sex pheromone protein [unclassified Granulicatella]